MVQTEKYTLITTEGKDMIGRKLKKKGVREWESKGRKR